jgi:hypothetical protein
MFALIGGGLLLFIYVFDIILDPYVITNWVICEVIVIVLDQLPFEILRFMAKKYRY